MHWIEELWEVMAKGSLYNCFDWVYCILTESTRLYKLMMIFMNSFPKVRFVKDYVSHKKPQIKKNGISFIVMLCTLQEILGILLLQSYLKHNTHNME
jgi:hypothetical protein